MAKQSSYEVKPLTDKEKENIHKVQKFDKLIRVGPKGYVLMEHFLDHADGVYNFPLRSDDIFVVTYPRSGTTWTQELVWLVANDMDFEKAKLLPLQERYKFLEYFMFFMPEQLEGFEDKPELKKMFEANATPAAEVLKNTPGQRFIKTHLPISLLPPDMLNTSKVVYVARNMKDVAVSWYHFGKANKFTKMHGDFKTYYQEMFSKDLCTWSPYFEHIKEGWEQRNHPNMLFLLYEDLSKDLKSAARRVADFLGKTYTNQQYEQLCEHLKFDNFKKNEAVDSKDLKELGLVKDGEFIRKGKAGGWREHFDEEISKHADSWIKRELQGTGLSFPES